MVNLIHAVVTLGILVEIVWNIFLDQYIFQERIEFYFAFFKIINLIKLIINLITLILFLKIRLK